jgi:hypothetical protein
MRLLPLSVPSTAYADHLSALIWRLSRPDAGPTDTQRYCGHVVHPAGHVALSLPEAETQPIHAEAAGAIETFCNALSTAVPAQEIDTLRALLLSARGGRVNVLESLPATLQAHLIDEATAQAQGWFPAQEAAL